LRVGERFLYEYDLTDRWCHDVRVEAVLPVEQGRHYPVCTGGRRSAPPEGCGGAWAFTALRQHYSPLRFIELLGVAEPGADARAKRFRYRYLVVAGLLVASGRRLVLKLRADYPLYRRFVAALDRLRSLAPGGP
jgi:Plasmid pRiA4b ORF-3-like protein